MDRCRALQRALRETPFAFRSPAEHAGVSAGRVNEDCIELFVRQRRAVGRIALHSSHVRYARALYIGAANLSSMGESERAMEWAGRAFEAGRNEPMVLYNVACTYALLGESDRAMELLEKAISLGWGDRAWLETDSDLDSLRTIPRFQALLDRIN